MRYVEEVLQPGEKILFVSTIHWLIYVPAILLLIAATRHLQARLHPPSHHRDAHG